MFYRRVCWLLKCKRKGPISPSNQRNFYVVCIDCSRSSLLTYGKLSQAAAAILITTRNSHSKVLSSQERWGFQLHPRHFSINQTISINLFVWSKCRKMWQYISGMPLSQICHKSEPQFRLLLYVKHETEIQYNLKSNINNGYILYPFVILLLIAYWTIYLVLHSFFFFLETNLSDNFSVFLFWHTSAEFPEHYRPLNCWNRYLIKTAWCILLI